MKKNFTSQVLVACLLSLAVVAVRADDVEQAQIDILHSDASVAKKWSACQELRIIGTARAVPEVAPLLTDPKLSQAARQTLEGLPYPEVDDVLSAALGKTTGVLKAGIIDSIGWRAKPASAALLIPLLSDSDTNIAAAAAVSLGRIGGHDAVAALSAARDNPPANVQLVVASSLLECAARLADNTDNAGAADIYRQLYDDKYPLGIRTAAWRGLVLTDPNQQVDLMVKALGGSDHALERVALLVLRQSKDSHLIQACADQWASLPAESQLAVLDAEVAQGEAGLPIVRTASQSPQQAIRVAAWEAMGELNDLESIPALAKAAAGGETSERQAARDSLARLHGPDAANALLAQLERADAPEKAELLRALGARQDAKAVNVLLQNATAGDAATRQAALDSLREIASPETLAPLLQIAESASDDQRDSVLEVLSAVCQASPDKDAATHAVIEAEGKLPASGQGAFLPLLAELGTPDALAAVQTASKSQDNDLAMNAARALSQWPNADAAGSLLDLSGTATNNALRILALRGAISVSGTETNVARRLTILEQAQALATRPDEKKEILGQLGQVHTPAALDMALKEVDNPDVSNEASLAVIEIAEKMTHSHPKQAASAAAKVLQQHPEGELFRRAWALRLKGSEDAPFIRDWLVCGPYAKAGVTGAVAIFNVPFGPEVRGETVDWKPAPSGNSVDLAGMFPGSENCAAYLRTSIIAPEDCSAVLLMGSDDGIKAWLNGTVVHSDNVDRPEKPDQDIAPINLKKGENELVFKISQGGGGWGACARIVSMDGKPIAGLRAERPTGAGGSLTGTQ